MRFFVKDLKATRSGFLIMMVFETFMFLFGFLMVVIINATVNHDPDYACIGSMMALMMGVFAGLLRGGGGLNRFRTAVSMGQTRRSYILADPFVTALHCGLGLVFAWILSKFEIWIYSLLYSGWELDFDFVGMLKWWHYLLLIAGACLMDFIFGAIQVRFGAKGFLVIWLPLCFSGMIFNSTVGAAQKGSTSLLAQIGHGILFIAGLLRPAMWAALGIVLLAAGLAFCVRFYWRAEIKM